MHSSPCVRVLVCACACVLAGVAGAGCKKGKPPELSPLERCQKGCERRLQCVEDLALDKAVTEANREHVKRAQEKRHKAHLDYCVKACADRKPRFQAIARCGLLAKDCEDFFRCESAAVKDLEAREPPGRPGEPRLVEPRMVEPRTVDARPVEPRPTEPRTVDARTVEPRPVDERPVEPRPTEPRSGDMTP